jgi:hypothetical protein
MKVREILPKADPELAQHFYSLFGRSLLTQMVELPSTAIMQSIRLALLAHETGVSVHTLVSKGTHLCGPRPPKRR